MKHPFKKALSLLLSLALVLSVTYLPGFADAAGCTVKVTKIQKVDGSYTGSEEALAGDLSAGDIIVVTLGITNNESEAIKLAGYQFTLNYDKTALELNTLFHDEDLGEDFAYCAVGNGWSVDGTTDTAGTVAVGGMRSTGVNIASGEDKELVRLAFQVKTGAESGTKNFTFSTAANAQQLSGENMGQTFSVTSTTPASVTVAGVAPTLNLASLATYSVYVDGTSVYDCTDSTPGTAITGGTIRATATSVMGSDQTANVTWSVDPSDAGVSIGEHTGVITVSPTATARGYTIRATALTPTFATDAYTDATMTVTRAEEVFDRVLFSTSTEPITALTVDGTNVKWGSTTLDIANGELWVSPENQYSSAIIATNILTGDGTSAADQMVWKVYYKSGSGSYALCTNGGLTLAEYSPASPGSLKVTVSARAPAGTYKISATYGGVTKSHEVTITRADAALARVAFTGTTDFGTITVPVSGAAAATSTNAITLSGTNQYGETMSSIARADASFEFWLDSYNQFSALDNSNVNGQGYITIPYSDALRDALAAAGRSQALYIKAYSNGETTESPATVTVMLADPVLTSFTIDDISAIAVPDDESSNSLTALTISNAKDQYGLALDYPDLSGLTWSVVRKSDNAEVEGISMTNDCEIYVESGSNTVKAAVPSTTGVTFTVTAKRGTTPIASKDFTIARAASVPTYNSHIYRGTGAGATLLTGPDNVVIPVGDTPNVYTYTAKLVDQYHTECGDAASLSINAEPEGVTWSWNTTTKVGMLTVSNNAIERSVVLAAYSGGGPGAGDGEVTVHLRALTVDWSGVDAVARDSIVYGTPNSGAFGALPTGVKATLNGTQYAGTFSVENPTVVQHPYSAGYCPVTVAFTISEGPYQGVKLTKTYENLIVTKAPLTVTAYNNSVTFGEAAEANGVAYSGFVNGDTAATFAHAGSLAYDFKCGADGDGDAYAAGTTAAGTTVKIIPKGITSDDYEITFVKGTLYIEKADISAITTTAPSATILANNAANTDAATLKTSAISLPATVDVEYSGDKTATGLSISWANATQTYNRKGGVYTYVGTIDLTSGAGVNFVNTNGLTLTATLTVSAVNVESFGSVTATQTLSKAAVTGATTLAELGIPTTITVNYDGGVAAASKDAVWDKTLAQIKQTANQVTATTDKTVTVTLVPASTADEWATIPSNATIPSVTLTITNKIPMDTSKISASNLTKDYGEAYDHALGTNSFGVSLAAGSGYGEITAISAVYKKAGTVVTKPTDAGEYTVDLTVETATHKGTVRKTLTINKVAATGTAPTAKTLTYDRTNQALVNAGSSSDGTVYYRIGTSGDGSTTIPTGKDASTTGYAVYWKIVGDGNHTDKDWAGPISVPIAKKEITVSGITVANKVYDQTNVATPVTTNATLSGKVSGDTLTVSVTSLSTFNDENVGTNKTVTLGTLTLGGANAENYKLATSGQQTTARASITAKTIGLTWKLDSTAIDPTDTTTSKLPYDGSAHTVTATATGVIHGDTVTVTVTDGEKTNVGKYTAKATALSNANYKLPSAVTQAWEITKQNQAALTLTGAANKTFGDAAFQVTAGGGSSTKPYVLTVAPTGYVTISGPDADGKFTITIVKASGDTELTLTLNRAGDGNYEAATAVTATFKIAAKTVSSPDITLSADSFVYDGTAKKPTVTVKDGETTIPATEYTVSYENNVGAKASTESGAPTVVITDAAGGNYNVSGSKKFTITPKSIEGVTISGYPTNPTYTGSAQTPEVGVKDGTKTLVKGTDYTVEYSSNTAVGTATITVKGKGNYDSATSKTATFQIAPAALTGTVTISGGTATGVAVGDTLSAVVNGLNTSVGLTYQWNRNGTAISGATASTYTVTDDDAAASLTVTVTASGSYTGSKTSAAVEVGKKTLGSTDLDISGNHGSQTVGAVLSVTVENAPTDLTYTLQWCRDGAPISGATGTSYTVTAADQGHSITVKLTATGEFTGELVSGAISFPAGTPTISASAKAGNAQVTVSWTVNANGQNITQYQVKCEETGEILTVSGATSCEFKNGIENGTAYTFTVTAIYAGGTAVSPTTAAVTPVAPTSSGSRPSSSGGSYYTGGDSGGSSGGGSSAPSTTTNNADGSRTTTTTNSDGSKTAVTTSQNGATTTVSTARDGSATTEAKTADGSTGTVKTDAAGNTVSAEAAPSEKAVADAKAKGEPVTLAVEVKATNSAASAAEIKIAAPASVSAKNPAKVEIPVANVTPSTVVVAVSADGSEKIIPTSTTTENGVALTVTGDVTIKVVENAKTFDDVKGNEWFANDVAWAASHEVMNGMGDGTFAPDEPTTQGMMEQILYNIDGNALVTPAEGESWWNAADSWAENGGVTTGLGETHDPAAPATREVDILMMYNYAQAMGYDVSARADLGKFSDVGNVSAEAHDAIAWAVAVGIIQGSTDSSGNIILDPQGVATRAQISAITERFCEKVMK